MTEQEASKPASTPDMYSEVLKQAGSFEESELEGSFTMKDGVVVEETIKKNGEVFDKFDGVEPDEEVSDTLVVAETAGGKKIQIAKDMTHSGYVIEFATGGQLPPELSGRWTNFDKALDAIKVYLNKNEG